jgi:hypothetical protein
VMNNCGRICVAFVLLDIRGKRVLETLIVEGHHCTSDVTIRSPDKRLSTTTNYSTCLALQPLA